MLVVDDDACFRGLAGRTLSSWGHAVVGEAGSVEEAFAAAPKLRPDTALVDIGLPDGDGFMLAQGRAVRTRVAPAQRGGMMTAAVRRVAIGEDDVLMREGIVRILTDAGLDVVAQAGDADDLLRRALAHRPDVAIVDVRMPPRREDDGLVAAMELRRRLPSTGVLILSQFCEPAFALDLIGERPEGVGYLLKERVGDVGTFLDAIARVAAGGSALDAEVVGRMLGRPDADDPLHALTPREHAVLAAMAEGKSNAGIAQSLFVGEATVEKHVTAIFRKLGMAPASTEHRRVHAVLTYLRGKAGRH